jgi:hypothetical protein
MEIRQQARNQSLADAGPRRGNDGDETAQRHLFLRRGLCAAQLAA